MRALFLLLFPVFALAQVSEHNESHKAMEQMFNQASQGLGVVCTATRTGRYAVFEDGTLVYPTGMSATCTTNENYPKVNIPVDPVEPEPIDPVDPPVIPELTGWRGIPNPSYVLGFDVFADYETDIILDGSLRRYTVSCNGTASNPCFVDASAATFTHLTISGEYIVLEGGKVNAPSTDGPFVRICSTCVVRDLVVEGPGTDQGGDSVIGMDDGSVWIGGEVFNFGDARVNARENDNHGFKVQTGSNNPGLWILNAHVHHMSGDSVQVGDASRGSGHNVYIGGGYFHDNRENAVDVKDSTNIVISGITMSGFPGTNSDPGSAIVVHDRAFGSKMFDNIITDSNIGIVSSGMADHVIDGNNITARSRGIECRNTANITIANNVIDAPTPFNRQSNCDVQ